MRLALNSQVELAVAVVLLAAEVRAQVDLEDPRPPRIPGWQRLGPRRRRRRPLASLCEATCAAGVLRHERHEPERERPREAPAFLVVRRSGVRRCKRSVSPRPANVRCPRNANVNISPPAGHVLRRDQHVHISHRAIAHPVHVRDFGADVLRRRNRRSPGRPRWSPICDGATVACCARMTRRRSATRSPRLTGSRAFGTRTPSLLPIRRCRRTRITILSSKREGLQRSMRSRPKPQF